LQSGFRTNNARFEFEYYAGTFAPHVSASAQPNSTIVLAQFNDWTVYNNGNLFAALTLSPIMPNPDAFLLAFDKGQQCQYRFVLASRNDSDFIFTSPIFFNIEYRIDAKEVWRSDNVLLNAVDKAVVLATAGVDKLIRQIARGNQLSVTTQLVGAKFVYREFFSLRASVPS
jgi:hypothetical protein